jgi:hypothetical protein
LFLKATTEKTYPSNKENQTLGKQMKISKEMVRICFLLNSSFEEWLANLENGFKTDEWAPRLTSFHFWFQEKTETADLKKINLHLLYGWQSLY